MWPLRISFVAGMRLISSLLLLLVCIYMYGVWRERKQLHVGTGLPFGMPRCLCVCEGVWVGECVCVCLRVGGKVGGGGAGGVVGDGVGWVG